MLFFLHQESLHVIEISAKMPLKMKEKVAISADAETGSNMHIILLLNRCRSRRSDFCSSTWYNNGLGDHLYSCQGTADEFLSMLSPGSPSTRLISHLGRT
jgi:hypothetical protein